jgi:hypothetical protein
MRLTNNSRREADMSHVYARQNLREAEAAAHKARELLDQLEELARQTIDPLAGQVVKDFGTDVMNDTFAAHVEECRKEVE